MSACWLYNVRNDPNLPYSIHYAARYGDMGLLRSWLTRVPPDFLDTFGPPP